MADQIREFNKQFDEQCQQMAVSQKVMGYASKWREIVEHFVIWGIAPMVGFHYLLQFLSYVFNPWWASHLVGSAFVTAIWLTDRLRAGNFVIFKRIAHLATAYILIAFR